MSFNDIVYLLIQFVVDIVLLHGLVSGAMLSPAIYNGHVRSSDHRAVARLDAVGELCLETQPSAIRASVEGN
tara:strand:+ start:224 stop:439 length:216 start_codon:yes stop_codon:yes gene_type:complete